MQVPNLCVTFFYTTAAKFISVFYQQITPNSVGC